MLSLALLLLLALVILYRTISSIVSARRFRRFEVANKCAPIPNVSAGNILPWNLGDLFDTILLLRAGKDIFECKIIPTFAKYGNTWAMYANGKPGLILTSEPANFKTMLATKFQDYEVGDARRNSFGILLGSSIFTTDGPAWERARAMFRPQFSRESINDLESAERAVRVMFRAIGDPQPGEWTPPVDLAPFIYRFTLDTATKFLFGESTESQESAIMAVQGKHGETAKASVGEEFGTAIFTTQAWLSWRVRFGNLYWLIDGPSFRRALNVMKSFASKYVDRAVDLSKSPTSAGKVDVEAMAKPKFSLLNAMAQSTMSKDELRGQLLGILLAGRDTTATLLLWAFLVLALRPTEMVKLRTAILDDLGDTTCSRGLDFAKLKSCRYLQYFMFETLRLFTPIPGNSREAIRDTILPCGGGPDGKSPIAIRKGQMVAFSSHVMHLRKDLWGEDAHEFKPERWINRKWDWTYQPFSGGPRVCLGQQYALTEAGYVLARMLQHYDGIEIAPCADGYVPKGLVGETWDIRRAIAVTQYPRDGCNVRLRLAKRSKPSYNDDTTL